MDLMDNAASHAQQVASNAARLGLSATGKLVKISARMSANGAQLSVRAVGALLSAARDAVATKRQEGKVSLRQFTRMTDAKREVVGIKDSDVARQLAKELRKHGVLFSVEPHRDGTVTFHVQGKDASLIEHALTVASTAIDQRLAATRPTSQVPDEIEPTEQTITLNQEQKGTIVQELRDSADRARADEVGTGRAANLQELAATIEQDGAIVLTEGNVATIDNLLTEKGWQVSSLQDTPEHMREVVNAVDERRVELETRSLDHPTPTRQQDPTPIQSQDRAGSARNTGTETARATPKERQLSKRDATRKRVGDRIENAVATEKKRIAATRSLTKDRVEPIKQQGRR